jgi:hypothetical protein
MPALSAKTKHYYSERIRSLMVHNPMTSIEDELNLSFTIVIKGDHSFQGAGVGPELSINRV